MTEIKPKKAYTEVRGHGLQNEGAPHRLNGDRSTYCGGYQIGGVGYAKCSCGTLSPELISDYKRKQWHREHKAQIVSLSVDPR